MPQHEHRLEAWRWPLVVLMMGLCAAAAAAWLQHQRNLQRIQTQLDFAAQTVAERLHRRMQAYEYGLVGARGALLAGRAGSSVVGVPREAFAQYVASFNWQRRFPGARGIGFVRKVPRAQEGAFEAQVRRAYDPDFRIQDASSEPANTVTSTKEASERFVVLYLEPRTAISRGVGFDLGTDPVQRAALLSALLQARTSITPPLLAPNSPKQPARVFMLALPAYSVGPDPSPQERNVSALGWLQMLLAVPDIMAGIDLEDDSLAVAISDVTDGSRQDRFFTTSNWSASAAIQLQRSFQMFDRRWQLEIQPQPAFIDRLELRPPMAAAGTFVPFAAVLAFLLYGQKRSTSRIQALNASLEQEVQQRTAELRAVLDSAASAIIACDLQGHITLFNPAAERQFRMAAGAARGQPLRNLHDRAELQQRAHQLPPEVQQVLLPDEAPVVAEQPISERSEWTYVRADGTRFPGLLSLSVMRTPQGHDLGFLSVILDLSERKSLETELHARTQQAEAATAAKSAFLARMSHEVRTPLGVVIGFCELLERVDLAERPKRYVHNILAAGEQMLALVNDLLDMAKVEAGEMHLEAVPFDPRSLLQQIHSLHEMQASQKGLALIWEADPRLPSKLCGDPLRLKQIVVNLVSNAVKFTTTGHVTLRAQLQGLVPPVDGRPHARATICLSVRDTGIGIAPEKVATIFQPFIQADTTTARRYGGTGLGLSIVSNLVELMDGELTVESTPGTGSTFNVKLTLPVAD